MHGLVDRGNDQVAGHLGVVRVEYRRIELNRNELSRTSHRCLDHTTTGAADIGLGGECLLGFGHLGLHLLRLLHELTHIFWHS